jgi:hypothetical protein
MGFKQVIARGANIKSLGAKEESIQNCNFSDLSENSKINN